MSEEIIKRDSFVFYRSFAEVVSGFAPEVQLAAFQAIVAYALDGEEPNLEKMKTTIGCFTKQPSVELENNLRLFVSIFSIIRQNINANNLRYKNAQKGGAPKGNKNAEKQKDTSKNNRRLNLKQPTVTVTDTETVTATALKSGSIEGAKDFAPLAGENHCTSKEEKVTPLPRRISPDDFGGDMEKFRKEYERKYGAMPIWMLKKYGLWEEF